MKRFIPAIIAIVLILILGASYVGKIAFDKLSYSTEKADLKSYFDLESAEDIAVYLQDEPIEADVVLDGTYYMNINDVHSILNGRFYYNEAEQTVSYTEPGENHVITVGENGSYAYTPAKLIGGKLYLALAYVKEYTNFSYEGFSEENIPERLQIYTEFPTRNAANLTKATKLRIRGGVKSEILCDLEKGDTVYVMDVLENWSKVRTNDCFVGYVENKFLSETKEIEAIPVTEYEAPSYPAPVGAENICVGWHQIGGTGGNDTIYSVTEKTKGMNVLSPTWYALTDSYGNFVSYGSQDYVARAHEMGMEVWALIDDFTYQDDVSDLELFSSSESRATLINNLVNETLRLGADGINIDFENVNSESGEHFVQFIRELSIPCHENGITLSIDNYVPLGITSYYNRAEQGVFADYIIIMGYDEHYPSSTEAGSVASINYTRNGIEQTLAEVPNNKVINGIPFYTRIWYETENSLKCQTVDMGMAIDYVKNHQLEQRWDEETCQNYAEGVIDGEQVKVWLEDIESIQTKLNVMDKYDLAGVAVWKLGFEIDGVWDVIEAYISNGYNNTSD